MSKPITTFKNRMLELMYATGCTQAEIVRRTGLSKGSVSRYISGKQDARQDKVAIIADAFGVEPAWLLGYDVPMQKATARPNGQNVRFLKYAELVAKYDKLTDDNKYIISDLISRLGGDADAEKKI